MALFCCVQNPVNQRLRIIGEKPQYGVIRFKWKAVYPVDRKMRHEEKSLHRFTEARPLKHRTTWKANVAGRSADVSLVIRSVSSVGGVKANLPVSVRRGTKMPLLFFRQRFRQTAVNYRTFAIGVVSVTTPDGFTFVRLQPTITSTWKSRPLGLWFSIVSRFEN